MNRFLLFLGVVFAVAPGLRAQSGKDRDWWIDSVEFQSVDLPSALAFLGAKAEGQAKGPVNFVLIDPDKKLTAATVTLKLGKVPWTEALRYTCSLAGAEYAPGRNAVVVGGKEAIANLRLQRTKIGVTDEGEMARLEEVVIEEVAFKDTTLAELAEFFGQWAASQPGARPLNVMVKENAAEAVATRVFSLQMKGAPVSEILHYATGLAGCRFRVDRAAVVIGESEDIGVPPGGPANPRGPLAELLSAKRLDSLVVPAGMKSPEFVEMLRALSGVNTISLAPEAVAASKLSLRRVTAFEALRFFNEVSGTAYRLDPNAVVIYPDPAVKNPPKPAAAAPAPVDPGGKAVLKFDP